MPSFHASISSAPRRSNLGFRRIVRRGLLAVSFGIGANLASGLRADVIVLRNGNEIQGEVVAEDRDSITVRFPGGTLRLARRQVEEVKRQSRLVYLREEAEKAVRRGDWREAIALLETSRDEHPNALRPTVELARVRRLWAEELVHRNRFDAAVELYETILGRDPDDRSAREGRDRAVKLRDDSQRELAALRARVEHGDPANAVEELEKLRERYPDLRDDLHEDLAEAWLRRAQSAYSRADWPDVTESLWKVATLSPDRIDDVREPFVRSILERIGPLLEEGDFKAAGDLARRGIELDPDHVALNFYKALSLEASEDEEQARTIYLSLIDDSTLANAPISELRAATESFVLESDTASGFLHARRAMEVLPGEFRVFETAHFALRHRSPQIAAEVARVAERHYARLFRELGCQTHWRNRCEIVIHPDQKSYLDAASVDSWSSGAHQIAHRFGVFSEHRIHTWQQQKRLTTGVIQHEITHALLAHRLNCPQSIPLWANEGFAVSEEPEYVREHYRRIVQLERGRRGLLPLGDVLTAEAYPEEDNVELFYAEAHGVVEFLLERRGVSTFIAFLKDLATKKDLSIGDALRSHYRFESISALENRWLGSL